MANELAGLSSNLARNLLALRNQRGISQAQLARLAGIPRSTVTHLESGEGNPSLSNLAKVAGALQISIEELLARPRAACKLVKVADQIHKRRGKDSVRVFKLLPDPIPGMELDRLELGPGDRMGGIPHTRGTKEYLTCVEGEITVAVAGEKYVVAAGDVLAFPGDQPHSYHNSGKGPAVGVSVVALAPAHA